MTILPVPALMFSLKSITRLEDSPKITLIACAVRVAVVVSTVIAKASETALSLPATSVALAVMLCGVVLWVKLISIENVPLAFTVSEPMAVVLVPLYNLIVAPTSALPVMVRFEVLLVRLSLLLVPESSSVAKSKLMGLLGTTVSTL